MATSTKDKAAAETVGGFAAPAASIDRDDLDIGWTAQSGTAHPGSEAVPSQLFTPEQLPDPQAAIDAGVPQVVIPENQLAASEPAKKSAKSADPS